MKIPKSVKIGEHIVKIKQNKHVIVRGDSIRGSFTWDVDNKKPVEMQIASHHANGYKYPVADKSETFWHEITHAILFDMDHKQKADERFVSAFAERLNQAIRSAKF